MTLRTGSSARTKALVALPVALLFVALVTGTVAWFILQLPMGAYDPLNLPRFYWYYRHDPVVRDALGLAAVVSVPLTALGLVMVLRPKKDLHGTARFAREGEIAKAGLRAKSGILLGRAGGRFLLFGGTEHVLLEAPTRSGKGVGVVIPNLLSWQDSVVVLDVKQENFAATARFRKDGGQKVVLFNPTDKAGRTARYNPLSYIDRSNPIEVLVELQKIATMLYVPPEKGEAFWTESARTGFVGVGAWIAAKPERPFTFGEIYRTITMPGMKAFFGSEARDRALSDGCRAALSDFTSSADNTFTGIVQSITAKLNLWINPVVDRATAESDFSLSDLRRRPTSIYLGVSPDELDRVAPLYNLFFQQLVDLNTRQLPGEDEKLNVLVILDEFARLGRAQVIANAFSYVAGYGMRLLPVIQSRSQLRQVYGEHGADEIVANCGVEIAFTPKELRVAKELSERLGFHGQNQESRSLTIHGMLANRSKTISEQRRALMLPQELMQMPDSDLLVIRGGIPVVRGEKIRYYRDKVFKSRVLPAPEVQALPTPPAPLAVLDDLSDEALASFNDCDNLAPDQIQDLPVDVLALERDMPGLTVKSGFAFDDIDFDDILGPDPSKEEADNRRRELVLSEGEDYGR
ncbi:type IV secretory system conjugative DNA transfer family protein [Novosphingobium sp. RD2P27]|uniref:Type IV secretory system conjugative DNA transfer family protein n=1 Tax=Novosphingobium kalidii TaxID=3230299 RepID=A0ABV2D3R7_9SPHN